jgi:hypothetical protein
VVNNQQSMTILINSLGVQDSGGISVLDKVLSECARDKLNNYFIICSDNKNINELYNKYKNVDFFEFKMIKDKGAVFRLYYENIVFRRYVKEEDAKLIYNFTGTTQFFIKNPPQLVKIHNILFYSKKLNTFYHKKRLILKWCKDILVKRAVLVQMLNHATYLEIQSLHVKQHLSDFINTRNKIFYVKSDIDVSDKVFHIPRQYNFTKKIKFLYIVGPHFESLHKNFQDFTNAMVYLIEAGINFEINITLTNDQLKNSKVWDASLNSKTNFLGYISDQEKMTELFCDNTILISTSFIETLGLHVIEGIKNGVITISPDEDYSNSVYGDNMFTYELFNKKSLRDTITSIIDYEKPYDVRISSIQDDLKQSEMKKIGSILDVFNEVLNVQK